MDEEELKCGLQNRLANLGIQVSGFCYIFEDPCNAKPLLWETQLPEISSFSTTFPFVFHFLLVPRRGRLPSNEEESQNNL